MSPSDFRRADRSLRVSFWLLFLALALLLGLPLLDPFEARLAPVVRDFRVAQAETGPRSAIISGDMRKVRDCAFLGLTWYIGDPFDREAPRERLRFRFLDQPEHADRTRIAGRQPWGPWELFRPVQVQGPSVFMRVTHACHPLFDTTGIYFTSPAADIFGAGHH